MPADAITQYNFPDLLVAAGFSLRGLIFPHLHLLPTVENEGEKRQITGRTNAT